MDQSLQEQNESSTSAVKHNGNVSYLSEFDKRFEGTEFTKKSGRDIVEKEMGGNGKMPDKDYVTHNDFKSLEEKFDLKIKVAILPIEAKIDRLSDQVSNLPITFENLLLKEREYQEAKRKETQRFFWGTIGIGVVGALIGIASILVPILNK